MAKRCWSESNEAVPPGRVDASVPGANQPPTPVRNSSKVGSRPSRQSLDGPPGESTLPQISRKIKACAACRKHKVS